MAKKKKIKHPKVKLKLHSKNKHRERYNFDELIAVCPELKPFVITNEFEDDTIDFFNPDAVKMLNRALLKQYYDIEFWDIPTGYLCPPIPGRADYIHHIASHLKTYNKDVSLTGPKIKCLDIGVGANCVYPIIGVKEYGWHFVGSDIDPIAIHSANQIINLNPVLSGKVEVRLQTQSKSYFDGIVQKDELFDLTICNPPFHESAEEALEATSRKLKNLKGKNFDKLVLNFGGKSNELWYTGGERKFVLNMIFKSKQFAHSCFLFSTLVSKQSNLKAVYEALEKLEAIDVKTIQMGQGHKVSRIVTWTFLSPDQQRAWRNKRWK
jgi:23S rRNA (adenine1618-N6)-methyltransferase